MHEKKEFVSKFDFTAAKAFASCQEIKAYRHEKPNYGAAGFLKMIWNNIKDYKTLPENISVRVNNVNLLAAWQNATRMWNKTFQLQLAVPVEDKSSN